MTSTAPAKTAAAATSHGGVYTTLVESLAQEVVDAANPSPEHASNVLLALGALRGDDAATMVPLVTLRCRHCCRCRVRR